MAMAVPSFLSDPYVQYLQQLLREIEQGLLQVPRFERPFVWTIEQRYELLRSVRDGILPSPSPARRSRRLR